METVELKRWLHRWKCPYCGLAKLTFRNEGAGKDNFACRHYVASRAYTEIKEDVEIIRTTVDKNTRLTSMEDWEVNKTHWGLDVKWDKDEGSKYLKQIKPDIEVRIIRNNDEFSLEYLSYFYKEEGAPYQQID